MPASLAILDDNIPEFNESFTVVLTSASGGAVLGDVLSTTVIILANDDPNGALGESPQEMASLCCQGEA